MYICTFLQRKHHSTEYLAEEVRITLKSISSLAYNCTVEHQEALLNLNNKLQKLMCDFMANFSHEDGILRPQLRKKLKLSKQRKLSQCISSLPSQPKLGRKKNPAFRNRVVREAQTL